MANDGEKIENDLNSLLADIASTLNPIEIIKLRLTNHAEQLKCSREIAKLFNQQLDDLVNRVNKLERQIKELQNERTGKGTVEKVTL